MRDLRPIVFMFLCCMGHLGNRLPMVFKICVWIQGRSLLPELLPAQLLLVILHLETNGRAKTKNRPWNDIQGNRLPRGSGHHPAKTPARRRFNPNPNQGTILTLICDIKQL